MGATRASDAREVDYMHKSYGFFPQMKAEGIAFKEEKSGALVVGTNPGYHNGVLIIYELSKGDRKPDGERLQQIGDTGSNERYVCDTK